MKSENAAIAFFVGMWITYVILCVGAVAGVTYGAIHFIRKFW